MKSNKYSPALVLVIKALARMRAEGRLLHSSEWAAYRQALATHSTAARMAVAAMVLGNHVRHPALHPGAAACCLVGLTCLENVAAVLFAGGGQVLAAAAADVGGCREAADSRQRRGAVQAGAGECAG